MRGRDECFVEAIPWSLCLYDSLGGDHQFIALVLRAVSSTIGDVRGV